jgi:mRNA-degrading endonuclease toxin of MazEF toxin-antitoxin module
MQKDFDVWNEKKKFINNRTGPFFHEREVWWVNLGVNVGFEQDGVGENYSRPVIILKGLSSSTCLVIPLTTSSNIHKLRIPVGKIENEEAVAILSQIKVVDSKRFIHKVCVLGKEKFEEIRKSVKDML